MRRGDIRPTPRAHTLLSGGPPLWGSAGSREACLTEKQTSCFAVTVVGTKGRQAFLLRSFSRPCGVEATAFVAS